MADTTVALVASMQVQLRDFEKQMVKAGLIAEKGVKNIEQKFAHANPALPTKFAEGLNKAFEIFAVTETVQKIREVVKSVAELNDEAKRVGVTTNYLQEFEYAVRATGGTTEDAAAGLDRLNQSLEGTDKSSVKFQRMMELNGITIKGMSVEAVNSKVIDLINSTADASLRANIATIAWGESGKKLIDVTEGGSEGVAKLREEAHKLGIVFDEDAVKKAHDANVELAKLEEQFTAMWQSMALEVGTAIPQIIDYLTPLQAWLNTFMVVLDEAGTALHNFLQTGELKIPTLEEHINALIATGQPVIDPRTGQVSVPAGSEPVQVNMGEERPRTGRPRLPPPRTGGGGSVRDRDADTLAKLQQELKLVTATGDERTRIEFEEKKIQALRSANVTAASAEGKEIIATVDAIEQATIAQKHLLEVTEDFRNAASDALSTMVDDLLAGKSAAETLNDVMKNLLNTIVQIGERKLIEGLFGESGQAGGGALGGILASFFRQSGGPVSAGRPYMVGEHGPEMIVPSSAGMVIPNGALSAANNNGGVQINIINQSGSQIQQRQRNQGGKPVIDILVAEMGKRIGGGDFDSAMRGRYGARPIKVR